MTHDKNSRMRAPVPIARKGHLYTLAGYFPAAAPYRIIKLNKEVCYEQ